MVAALAERKKRRSYSRKSQLVQAFGCSSTTVKNWTNKADFPGGNSGPWDHEDVAEWLTLCGSPFGDEDADDDENDLASGDVRKQLMQEQHRKLKLQNDKLAGQLVQRDEVEQSVAELFLRIKQRLEAVPDELEIELPTENRAYIKQRVADKIYQTLLEMSQWEIEG